VSARTDTPTLTLAVTTLETFLQCPRRGFFAHRLRLSEAGFADRQLERSASGALELPLKPLEAGRLAHAVLAAVDRCHGPEGVEEFVEAELGRAGVDAGEARVADLQAELVAFLRSADGREILGVPAASRRAELPFSLKLGGAGREVIVHGQIDLLCWSGDRPWVVDYKHARRAPGAEERYQLQLELYALAVERLCGVTGDIRTTLFFLKDRTPAHAIDVSAAARRGLEARIGEAARQIADGLPAGASWPGLAVNACRALGCGFVGRCHPAGG
jgi:hypothetical protein